MVLTHGVVETPFFDGAELLPGQQLTGPALIVHPDTTIFLGPRDQLQVDEYKNLIINVNQTNG